MIYPNDTDPIKLAYVMSLMHTSYKWGGNSPLSGLDCSGFVVELLKMSGIVPERYDASAQGLYDYFTDPKYGAIVKGARFGSLAFFGKDDKSISHTTYCLDSKYAAGSNGGDSHTVNLASAIERDARVKIRLIRYRPDLIAIVHPHQPPWA